MVYCSSIFLLIGLSELFSPIFLPDPLLSVNSTFIGYTFFVLSTALSTALPTPLSTPVIPLDLSSPVHSNLVVLCTLLAVSL